MLWELFSEKWILKSIGDMPAYSQWVSNRDVSVKNFKQQFS